MIGIAVLVLLIFAFIGILLFRKDNLQNSGQAPQEVDNERGTPNSPLQESDIYAEPTSTAEYLEGYFVEKPFVINGYIMGDFMLNDKPDSGKIRIVFTDENGNFSIGRTSNGQILFEMLDATALMDFIEPNETYELRIFQTEPTNEFERLAAEELNQLKNDTNIEDLEYSLTPTMIRRVE